MTPEGHKTVQYSLVLIAIIVIGYFVQNRNTPGEPKIEKQTVQLQPIIIEGKDWKPVVINPGKSDPYIPQSNDSLRMLYIKLFEQNSQTVSYDTTFADTNYTEHLSFSIRENKLDKFTRELTIINTNTEKIKQQTFGIYGGLALHNTAGIINPALLFTYQPRQGSLYTLGKDVTGTGFIIAAQIPIFRRYK